MSTRRGGSPPRYYPSTTTRRVLTSSPQPIVTSQQPMVASQQPTVPSQHYYHPQHVLSTQPQHTMIPYHPAVLPQQQGTSIYSPQMEEYATQAPQQATTVMSEPHLHETMPVISGPTYYTTYVEGQLLLVPQGYRLVKM